MTRIVIPHRWRNDPCWAGDALSIKDAAERARLAGANLAGANLAGARLAGANLDGARLAGANLDGARLAGANLAGANLDGASLAGANLAGASLAGANLAGANLAGASLAGASLDGASLDGASLDGASLDGANLDGARLAGAKGAVLAIASTRILPAGAIVGWKRCSNGAIVRLDIPAEAKRSHAFGRKCRAEFAIVAEVIGAEFGVSFHDPSFRYVAGETVRPSEWCEDGTRECAAGIHFFITREEAEAYVY